MTDTSYTIAHKKKCFLQFYFHNNKNIKGESLKNFFIIFVCFRSPPPYINRGDIFWLNCVSNLSFSLQSFRLGMIQSLNSVRQPNEIFWVIYPVRKVLIWFSWCKKNEQQDKIEFFSIKASLAVTQSLLAVSTTRLSLQRNFIFQLTFQNKAYAQTGFDYWFCALFSIGWDSVQHLQSLLRQNQYPDHNKS